MAKADRLDRLDTQRLDLEAEYLRVLVEALRVTAAGRRGLFDHRSDKSARAAVAPVLAELAELGDQIDRMREQLFLPPFELQQEFLAARGPVSSAAVGEPRQAQAWLARLGVPATAPAQDRKSR